MNNNNEEYLELIRNNFLAFCCYIVPNFKTPPHVIEICNVLQDMVDNKLHRLIISLPPRMGKSFLCSILFPAFLLGKDPSNKIIASTYGFDLSKNFSKQLLDIISSEEYKIIFPHTQFENKGKSSTIWYTNNKGYYKSTSRGSAITGLSANWICADDTIKNSSEAQSPTLLKSIKDWFYSTLYSRLTNKSNGEIAKVLIIMTRWSKGDIISHILENDTNNEWKYINYPALDSDNNPLWEEQQSKELLLSIKKNDPSTFAALYQGNPGGDLAAEFNINDYTIYPVNHEFKHPPKYYFSSWDTASKISSNNDWTVGTLWSVRNNKLYLEDYERGKYTLPELHKKIEEKHIQWNCKFSLIEDANSGTGLLQLFESSEHKYYGIKANVKKKLSLVVPLLSDHSVILKQHSVILEELSEFPFGKHDDCVASVVNAIWYWATNLKSNNSSTLKINPLKSRRDIKKLIY